MRTLLPTTSSCTPSRQHQPSAVTSALLWWRATLVSTQSHIHTDTQTHTWAHMYILILKDMHILMQKHSYLFKLFSPSPLSPFLSLFLSSPVIIVNSPLDYEKVPEGIIYLTVMARDGGNPSLNSSVSVTIELFVSTQQPFMLFSGSSISGGLCVVF